MQDMADEFLQFLRWNDDTYALGRASRIAADLEPAERDYALSLLNFCSGNLEDAFRGLNQRYIRDPWGASELEGERWSPKSPLHQTLLWAPAGASIGAQIMHIGYLHGLDFDGGLLLDERLTGPASRFLPKATLVRDAVGYPFQTSLLSAGWIRRSIMGTVERPAHYLTAKADSVAAVRARWQERFGDGRYIVGVAWRDDDGEDGLDAIMASVIRAKDAGHAIISLQEAPDIRGQCLLWRDGDVWFDPGTLGMQSDFESRLANIAACNMVITASNSLAHASGAMGVPTLLYRGSNPSWEWRGDFVENYLYSTVSFGTGPRIGETPPELD